MDPIKLEKIQAMNKYKNQLLINNFILYSLTILTCTLFCSTPFWYPPLFSCIKIYIFASLPHINSLFFSTKFLFIVSNLIIIFLLGESKVLNLDSSCSSSPIEVYYSKSVNEGTSLIHNEFYVKNKKEAIIEKFHEGKLDVNEALEREGFKDHLPAEELNKRADDFIARINRQRRLEAASYDL